MNEVVYIVGAVVAMVVGTVCVTVWPLSSEFKCSSCEGDGRRTDPFMSGLLVSFASVLWPVALLVMLGFLVGLRLRKSSLRRSP